MTEQSRKSVLGAAFREHRKQIGLTQTLAGQRASVAYQTVSHIESGYGQLGTLLRLLGAFDLVVDGRNLPTGASLGQRLRALRERRGISRRRVAYTLGVAADTIMALERDGPSRVETLERFAALLGAGLCLRCKGELRSFFTHAGNGSTHHGWQTPPDLLNRLYRALGTFDLDPCSPTRDRRRAPVRARAHFTVEDDGLSLPWIGRCFVNPPFGRALAAWVAKCRESVEHKQAELVVALLPARSDTRWFQDNIASRAHVFMLRGRLRFGGKGGQSAPFPSCIAVWGATGDDIERLRAEFADAWFVASALSG